MHRYKCECGKEFNNSQAFNGHRSQCLTHYRCSGREDDYYAMRNKQKTSLKTNAAIKREARLQEAEDAWVAEKHTCEKCGKVMIKKFGSGRFCSRACANSRERPEETKFKTSMSLLKTKNPTLNHAELLLLHKELKDKAAKTSHRVKYQGPELPKIDIGTKKKGFNSRASLPYSEQFWKKVFDNNNIEYEMNVNVWKPGPNNYHLDFLIGDVDVEIDGAFHELPECIEKDTRRTKHLESLGYKVYRIKWINPNSAKNKILVNKQIEDLFNYLGVERIY